MLNIQCSSPLVSPESYWCVVTTLEDCGFEVQPFHATVPTFGVWGFALASATPLSKPLNLPVSVAAELRFLDQNVMDHLFVTPRDLQRVDTEVNRLNNQVLVHYYEREWSRWQ
ncbi:MAG: hypothetical protein GY826_34490 [Fuerstiella sp.]|nr:hypothetical protein [Fuerstiella sp.]